MKHMKQIHALELTPPAVDEGWLHQRDNLIAVIKANLSGAEHEYSPRFRAILWTSSHDTVVGGRHAEIRTVRSWDCTRSDHVTQMRELIDEQVAFAAILREKEQCLDAPQGVERLQELDAETHE